MIEKKQFDSKLLQLSQVESRGVASMLGLCISDALGATTEFIPFDKQRSIIKDGFQDIIQLIKKQKLHSRSGRIGIWTDDASMALAMAYSLLYKKYIFNPIHIRYMFILWLEHGLGNGGRQHSIGLGGNISISISQFFEKQTQYAQKGSEFNNGNGSLMRLAPIPLAFSDQLQKAIQYSGKQSLTTHNGRQAQQCSKLLASIIVNLINRQKNQEWKNIIDKTCEQFKTQVQAVKYLALSKQQSQQMYQKSIQKHGKVFTKFNKGIQDRNWNWKNKNFTYSPTRNNQQPGYVGSYCMDALAMALYTTWHSSSFKDCAILNANFGGDCDTVGAIAGQITGAIYGVDEGMLKLYSQMDDYKQKRYEAFLVSYKLATKQNVIQNLENDTKLQQQQKQKQIKTDKQKQKISLNNNQVLGSEMEIQNKP